jgi:FkbM family methyltransferase
MDGQTRPAAGRQTKSLKVLVRTAITFFPKSKEIKIALQGRLNRLRNRPHDVDYEAFRSMEFPADLLILDIGANHGQSITSFRTLFPRCKIVSFEPSQILAQRLMAQHAGDPNITIHACGLGSAESTFTLYTPYYRRYCFDALASGSKEKAQTWLGPDTIFGFRRELLTVHEANVPLRTLDWFGLRPNLVKIDTEGFEYDVLDGGRRTISENRPVVLLESCTPRIEEYFRALDYVPATYRHPHLVEGTTGGDTNTFFLPRERSQGDKRPD